MKRSEHPTAYSERSAKRAQPNARSDLPDPLPHNPLSFDREKIPRTTTIACWNVNGITSANSTKHQFGFRKYVEWENPDVLVITEASLPEGDLEKLKDDPKIQDLAFLKPRYPYIYWGKGTGKTVVFSKQQALDVTFGFPKGTGYDREDAASRVITLEFEHTFLLATYVKNSGEKSKNIAVRQKWDNDFEPWIRELDQKKPVIWTGDFNVVREDVFDSNHSPDLEHNTQCFDNSVAGTHLFERTAHEALLNPPPLEHPRRPARKFVDVWRLIHGPTCKEYTHWGAKWKGWRIDGMIVSQRLLLRVRRCEIRHQVQQVFGPEMKAGAPMGVSDHWPVWMSLEMPEL